MSIYDSYDHSFLRRQKPVLKINPGRNNNIAVPIKIYFNKFTETSEKVECNRRVEIDRHAFEL